VPALRAFADRVSCTLVVTQPDRPAGRGHKLQPTPVKVAARELGIPTVEPERLRDILVVLAAVHADIYAVASYGKIVPQAILDLPRLGALNVHPSMLPLYRGATPLQSQLRDGVADGYGCGNGHGRRGARGAFGDRSA
jgi:methionyl-tRNA formyltransferase